MKEGPILFNAETVNAVLDDRKTHTRRVINPQPPRWKSYVSDPKFAPDDHAIITNKHGIKYAVKCPYGKPGDRLWVREGLYKNLDFRNDNFYYRADNKGIGNERWQKFVDYGWADKKYVLPIHMPRWASRITLEIVDVRVERVQDISEEDAIAEGCSGDGGKASSPMEPDEYDGHSARHDFQQLWDSINGQRKIQFAWEDDDGIVHKEMVDAHYSWDDNPYVWVVEFKRIKTCH